MSDQTEKTIVVIDAETGSTSEYVKKVSTTAKVEEIHNLLGQNDAPLFIYNRFSSVNEEDLICEAFDSEDAVIVWVGAPREEEERKFGKIEKKNIKNNSDYEIVVVVHTIKKGMPIFLQGNQLKAFKFDWLNWSQKIELYRKDGKDSFGEPIYKGWTYKLDMGNNIASYSYENAGLYIHERGQDGPRLVDPVGAELKKWQSDFLKPIGGKLKLRFKNIGTEPLILVFGKKTDFEGTPELAAGVEMNIEIKKNERGFEFGLSVATGGGEGGQREYKAKMFDAEEVAKGKLIKVWRESGEDKASIVMTTGIEQPLRNTRTVHYREEDRINRKYKIDKAVQIAGIVAGIGAAAAGGN